MPRVYHYDPSRDNACGTLPELGIDIVHYPGYENSVRRMHAVDVLLLSCVLEGIGTHYMDTDVYEERGRSVGVVNTGQVHDIVTETPMEIFNVFLDPERLRVPLLPGKLQAVLPRILPLHQSLGNRLNRMVRIPFPDHVKLRETLSLMRAELERREYGFEEPVHHLLTVFLTLCARAALASGVTNVAAGTDERMERLRAHIDESFAEPATLDELAGLAGMSRTYLCRRFKRYTGQSVFTYLIQRRLEAAVVRLRSGEEKIATVALESGFSDLAFFNRKFRSQFGTSPGEYRRRHAER